MIHEQTVIDPDVQKHKLMAALSYVWIFCLIPLFLRRDSKFAQFHAKQGLVLFLAEIIISLLAHGFIHDMLVTVAVIFSAFGIVKSFTGQWWEAPIIYELSKKIKL